jgi:excisionase family DNA binding protein
MDGCLLLRISEVCRMLSLSRTTVYSLLDQSNGLRTVRVGRARRVPADEVRMWIKNRVGATTPEGLP